MQTRHASLTVIRHAPTKKGPARGRGSALSAEGVRLARRLGPALGSFDYVCARGLPRHVETAIAMGFAVDDALDFSCAYVDGEFEHHAQWDWPQPYVKLRELMHIPGSKLAELANMDRQRWVSALLKLGAGSRALVVSSGGSIEPVLVACLPDADHAAWGAPFAHCDAATLTFDGTSFTSLELARAPAG